MEVAPLLFKYACIFAALVASNHRCCRAKRNNHPGLLQSSRLVIEMPYIKSCDIPGNSIVFSKFETRMVSKVDFGITALFNITRSVPKIEVILIQMTKCREVVSANTCESFQTWRFDKDPCKAFMDKNTPWSYSLEVVRPRMECPMKKATYRMDNLTFNSALLAAVPLPWEGNVWLIRFSMMESKTKPHFCINEEMRVHRVRD